MHALLRQFPDRQRTIPLRSRWILTEEESTWRPQLTCDQSEKCYSVNFTLPARRLADHDPIGGLTSRGQQGARIALRLPGAENGTPRDKQIRTRLDDGGDRVVSHAAVHFDFKCQAKLLPDFRQAADLFKREGDKLLPGEAGIDAHDEHVMD